MTHFSDNILHLPEYYVLGTKVEEHDLHYQFEAPEPPGIPERFTPLSPGIYVESHSPVKTAGRHSPTESLGPPSDCALSAS